MARYDIYSRSVINGNTCKIHETLNYFCYSVILKNCGKIYERFNSVKKIK